jgi:hypothetical protein
MKFRVYLNQESRIHKCLTIFIFMLCIHCFYGQMYQGAGGKSSSLGNASLTHSDNWSFFNNPGTSIFSKDNSIGLFYQNRFLLKELQSQAFSFVINKDNIALHGGAFSYGYEKYRQLKCGGGTSIRMTDNLGVGVSISYQGIQVYQGYESIHSLSSDLGFLLKVNAKIQLAGAVFNWGRTKYRKGNEEVWNTQLRFGLKYTVSSDLNTVFEIEKDFVNFFRFKSGLDYQIGKNFFLRCGMKTTPLEVSTGFGYQCKKISIDFGSTFTPRLGWCTFASFQYQLLSK